MYVIDRGTPGNVGKQSEPECGWCAKTDFSAFNNNETFNENVARAHLQVAVWGNAWQPEPPAIDPTAFGWSLEEASKTLIPTTLPSDTPLAQDDLLKPVRCSCSSETPCKTQRCGCSSAPKLTSLPSTIMRHSMKMSPALTFRSQSGEMHGNQSHRQLIQQLLDGHWKKHPKLLSRQHFPVTPRLHKMIY